MKRPRDPHLGRQDRPPEPVPPGAGSDLPVCGPEGLPQFQDKQARGQVRYSESYVGSPASSVTSEFVGNLGALIRRLADDVPTRRVPSAQECRYCDITKADCPEKIDVDHIPEGATDDF